MRCHFYILLDVRNQLDFIIDYTVMRDVRLRWSAMKRPWASDVAAWWRRARVGAWRGAVAAHVQDGCCGCCASGTWE